MKHLFTCWILLSAIGVYGQPLRDINYNYLYDPGLEFTFTSKVIAAGERTEVFWRLLANENNTLDALTVQFEVRKDLAEKTGNPITYIELTNNAQEKTGHVYVTSSPQAAYLVARINKPITNTNRIRSWLFYTSITVEQAPYLVVNNRPVLTSYTRLRELLTLKGFERGQPLIVSYYDDDFPAAGPPFAVAQARVSARLVPDTIFTYSDSILTPRNKGLYLLQADTSSSKGLAFRVEDDYPKLNKLQSLVGPMIYLCTRQEYEKLEQAGDDKVQFDKIILSITGNSERARQFMRSYFRRVEQANNFFSSYKEGWKTDRGMIYIIYGLPDAVYLVGNREVWEYNNSTYRGRFTFVRSSTLFDPDNHVLIREKKLRDDWYQMIDLWRKARF